MSQLQKTDNQTLKMTHSVADVVNQSIMIQEAIKKVMIEGEHYGIIPGTKKATMYKQGAEKLSLLFRLSPSYDVQSKDLDGEHRDYQVICTLTHITSGEIFGQGVGSCSTRETKYRFRNETLDTGEAIPADYQQNKGYYRAQGFLAAQINSEWRWCTLQRVEHDNPADYYNTALKMAKKRAHVDAVLTATAASDTFAQDYDDMLRNGIHPVDDDETGTPAPSSQQRPKSQTQAPPAAARSKWINATDKSGILKKEWEANISDAVAAGIKWSEYYQDLKKEYSISRTDEQALSSSFKHFEALL